MERNAFDSAEFVNWFANALHKRGSEPRFENDCWTVTKRKFNCLIGSMPIRSLETFVSILLLLSILYIYHSIRQFQRKIDAMLRT